MLDYVEENRFSFTMEDWERQFTVSTISENAAKAKRELAAKASGKVVERAVKGTSGYADTP
jgi:hypothetical protein